MRKYLALVLVLVSVFALTACGGGKESTGVFKSTETEVADAQKLPGKFELEELTIQYPEEWEKQDQGNASMLVAIRNDGSEGFKTNMNVLKMPSSKGEMAKMSTDDFKQQYLQQLKGQGMGDVEVINLEKGKWQGNDAIFVENTASVMGMDIHYSQYIVDNGKNMYIITFMSDQDKWEGMLPEVKSIISSVQIAEPKK